MDKELEKELNLILADSFASNYKIIQGVIKEYKRLIEKEGKQK